MMRAAMVAAALVAGCGGPPCGQLSGSYAYVTTTSTYCDGGVGPSRWGGTLIFPPPPPSGPGSWSCTSSATCPETMSCQSVDPGPWMSYVFQLMEIDGGHDNMGCPCGRMAVVVQSYPADSGTPDCTENATGYYEPASHSCINQGPPGTTNSCSA